MHISNQIKSFDYHGSKFSYLPWLLKLLPETKHFVDVFGGSASVILNRRPSQIETFNDINEKVVNFFKVLRDTPDELISALELTPHSRKEYTEAWYLKNDTPVERARKFFIRTQQSIWAVGAQEQLKGWGASISDSRVKMSEKTQKWLKGISNLYQVVDRLRSIQIENRSFAYILEKYNHPEILLYCDPPYDKAFRSATKYEFDFANQDFFDLHYYAKKSKAKVAISGYKTDFMLQLFKEFNFHEGPHRKNNRSDKEVYECLWTNYTI